MSGKSQAPLIAIADDDATFLQLTRKLLEREGYRVSRHSSGKQVMEWLLEHSPDLLLLDLAFHDLRAEEILQELKRRNRTVPPFVVITCLQDYRVAVEMMKLGALDFVFKDLTLPEILPSVLRRALTRIQQEKLLVAAETQARLTWTVMEQSYGAIMISSAGESDPLVYYMNPACAELLGCDSIEVIGKRFSEEKGLLYSCIELSPYLSGGSPFVGELKLHLSNNDARIVRCSMSSLSTPSGVNKYWAVTLQDVTAERSATERLLLSEERLRFAAESASFGYYDFNFLTGVNYWSSELKLLLGVQVTEEIKPGEGLISACVHPDDRALTLKSCVQALDPTGSGEVQLEIRVVRPDGSVRWVHVIGRTVFQGSESSRRPVRATGIILDIHERKMAEKALANEHAFNQAIVDTIGTFIVILDPKERIVRCNPSFERASGYSLRELQGRNFLGMFVPAQERTRVKATFDNLRRGDAVPNPRVNLVKTRDGSYRVVAWSNSVLTDEAGKVEYFIGVGRDITDLRRLERELLNVSDHEQQRIGRDLHDGITQELTAVKLTIELLTSKAQATAPHLVPFMEQVSKQLRRTATEIRLLSHNLSAEALKENGLQMALAELAAGTRASGVECEFKCEGPVSMPDSDVAIHLYRIAQEAVHNAVRHSGARKIQISAVDHSDSLQLMIKDNGCGFPPEKRQPEGLGLNSMKYRAELIGASLQFESNRRRGVCVKLSVRKDLARAGSSFMKQSLLPPLSSAVTEMP